MKSSGKYRQTVCFRSVCVTSNVCQYIIYNVVNFESFITYEVKCFYAHNINWVLFAICLTTKCLFSYLISVSTNANGHQKQHQPATIYSVIITIIIIILMADSVLENLRVWLNVFLIVAFYHWTMQTTNLNFMGFLDGFIGLKIRSINER